MQHHLAPQLPVLHPTLRGLTPFCSQAEASQTWDLVYQLLHCTLARRLLQSVLGGPRPSRRMLMVAHVAHWCQALGP